MWRGRPRPRASSMFHDWKVLVTIAVGMAVVSACERAWRTHRFRKSETWPISQGFVVETSVHQGKHEAVLTICYSYPVPNEPYPIPAEFQKEFVLAEEANHWADALDQRNVPVHYDPSNRWKSVLWETDLAPIVLANSGQVASDC